MQKHQERSFVSLRSEVRVRWTDLSTPGMGLNLCGESPLYVNPINQSSTELPAKGQGRYEATTRLRPGKLREPPRADPHTGWCGGWGRKSPGHPIG
jgi:hypothetical protein